MDPVPYWASEPFEVYLTEVEDGIEYQGPAFFRCNAANCRTLHTHSMLRVVQNCYACGENEYRAAKKLTPQEVADLRGGAYNLSSWEAKLVNSNSESDFFIRGNNVK